MIRIGYSSSIITFFALVRLCRSHSNLGKPLAYSRLSCKASEPWCKGACTPMWEQGSARFRNTPKNPSATWRRGQNVEVIWHKNNHVGGFIRRSLVPVKYMFDHAWHKKTAFQFGCWEQGTFQCGKNKVCGADLKGRAYRGNMKVPSVFPDGDYVFAQVWYGGLQWQYRYPKYADYFSCAFVRIKGGVKLTKSHTATWTGPSKCPTGSTRPFQCGGGACKKNKVFSGVPDEFKSGRSNQFVRTRIFGVKVMKHGPVKPRIDSSMMKKAMLDMKKDQANDAKIAASKQKTSLNKKNLRGPVKKVLVYNGYKVVAVIYNGAYKSVKINPKKPVSIRAFTGYGSNYNAFEPTAGRLLFKIRGRRTWSEGKPPYIYLGNYGKAVSGYKALDFSFFNKKLVFEITSYNAGGKFTTKGTIVLKT